MQVSRNGLRLPMVPFLALLLVLFLMPLLVARTAIAGTVGAAGAVSLNGEWEIGVGRDYDARAKVPGISRDPAVMRDEVLWYRRTVTLPGGSWTAATLELKGARFLPQVHVDGKLVGSAAGGMAPVSIALDHANVKPGATVRLEIALASLKNVSPADASYIPVADQWRSNVSSGLWDDVVLHLHGRTSIARIIPASDTVRRLGTFRFDLKGAGGFDGEARLRIADRSGKVLVSAAAPVTGARGEIAVQFGGKLRNWSPDSPDVYRATLELADRAGKVADRKTISYGVRHFDVRDKRFYLNGEPFVARGVTVVWPRWMRTAEGIELGYDEEWFVKNIIRRSKDLGANYLRFHLGTPPERLLDLCDRHGLLVQYEWSFFHGAPASKESLVAQYRDWLDLGMRHPSVALIHPYNETDGKELKVVWAALDEVLKEYPPLALADRDVIHIHKYWWSLFENLGLYYDSAQQFPKAIVADEFGGNYLDAHGDAGGYPTVKETLLRFLGRKHTREERLAFHANANVKVAEYWRRIGAAGFSPFTALASNEDGNHWFLGPLKDGHPKPVWPALAAAFSPQAASIELWDRNFLPNGRLSLPVYLFNDLRRDAKLAVRVTIEDAEGRAVREVRLAEPVKAFATSVRHVPLVLPAAPGNYVVKAELLNRPPTIAAPVVSSWAVRVMQPATPRRLRGKVVAVAGDEAELRAFLSGHGIEAVALDDPRADIILASAATWQVIAAGDPALAHRLQSAIERGKSVVLLDVGERPLGQGYPKKAGDLGPLQAVQRVRDPASKSTPLFGALAVKFTTVAEPESHLHPAVGNGALWGAMPHDVTRLWNGLRGGLIVPAEDMELSGLSARAFTEQWRGRGADEALIRNGPYFAYELQGFYAFSTLANDGATRQKLKDKVHFLVQDAPALAISINPDSPVTMTDLHQGYVQAADGLAESLVPLANAGKGFTRSPVGLVEFGPGKGRLIVSQLLTAGRLADGFGEPGLYGIRHDPVAAQVVLNMLDVAMTAAIAAASR